jgi:hypothetical protein
MPFVAPTQKEKQEEFELLSRHARSIVLVHAGGKPGLPFGRVIMTACATKESAPREMVQSACKSVEKQQSESRYLSET